MIYLGRNYYRSHIKKYTMLENFNQFIGEIVDSSLRLEWARYRSRSKGSVYMISGTVSVGHGWVIEQTAPWWIFDFEFFINTTKEFRGIGFDYRKTTKKQGKKSRPNCTRYSLNKEARNIMEPCYALNSEGKKKHFMMAIPKSSGNMICLLAACSCREKTPVL